LAALKKFNKTAHWEIAKGTLAQNIAYCSKEESRIAGPFDGKMDTWNDVWSDVLIQ